MQSMCKRCECPCMCFMTWPWFKLLHPEKEWSSANGIHHAQKYPSPRPLSPQLHVPSPSADLARGLQWLSEPHLFCDASRRQDCWMLRGSYAKLVAVAVARIVLEPLMKSSFMLEPCPQNTVCGVHAKVPMFAPITFFGIILGKSHLLETPLIGAERIKSA